MIYELHRLKVRKPKDVIRFIDNKYPKLKGVCFYDSKKRCLCSVSESVDFYFDPIHNVLHVKEVQ